MNPIRLRVLPALPGFTGAQGPDGPEGPQGPQGPPGAIGPEGPAVADGDKGDVTVSSSGAAWDINDRKVVRGKLWEPLDVALTVNLTEFGPDRTGVSTATPAFQAALNLPASGKIITVDIPEGTYNLVTSPVIGVGKVNWNFLPGAVLTGAGVLPFYQATMIAQPAVKGFGYRHQIHQGSLFQPDTTSGPEATEYVGRVDRTVRADDPTSLLHTRLTTLIRLDGGTGWIQANKTYVEDRRLSAGGETVAVCCTVFGFGPGAVWGFYSESAVTGYGVNRGSAIGYEINVSNFTDVDNTYVDTAPNAGPTTKALWILGRGKKNSFAIGIASDSVLSAWGAGIYMGFGTVDDYGIDIQAETEVGLRFKFGAKSNAGIGIEFGLMADAAYGTADGQGAILLRNHDMKMGATGNIAMRYNATSDAIEFYKSGVLKQSLSMV